MNVSWKREEGRLVRQWFEVGQPAPYNPSWMQEPGQVKPVADVPAFLDFTRLSPFSGRTWYHPDRRYGRHAA